MKIGFIGIGNMGLPMALNLAKRPNLVTGFDTVATVPDPLATADTARAAVRDADVVITMLPNGDILNRVYDDIVADMPSGALMIDCSTVDVAEARRAAAKAAERGVRAVDAPVSGGVQGAKDATLTFMVGADPDAFSAAEAVLGQMGRKIVHCGGQGAGQAAKVCNNMLLGISMLGVCEAFALADRLGLSRQKLFDVAANASGSCWSLNTYCPAPGIGPKSPADNGYAPGFAAELMLKDLELSQQSANSTGTPTRMGALATEIYKQFADGAGAGRDFSAYLDEIGKPTP